MRAPGYDLMRSWVEGVPDHLRAALLQASREGWPPAPAAAVRSVYLGGMGGSAMACHLARSILSDRSPIPLSVHQDPEIPAWVGRETLAVIVSYSGETWEALRMAESCAARSARLAAVACGGRLLSLPETMLPRNLRFSVPAGFAPRAALGWMLVPVLLAAAGPAAGAARREIEEAIPSLEEEIELWRRGDALPGRDPRALAEEIANRLAFIYSPDERFRVVGLRWKNQLLENGKQMACESAFSELAHNEIMGWEFAAGRLPSVFLFLQDAPPGAEDGGGSAGALRSVTAAAQRELARAGGRVLTVPGHGGGRTARLLSQLILADMTSVELARVLDIDPVAIEAIERVKQASRGGTET
jgi:glucose/mannose-6-phosphate isomerase